MNYGMSFLQDIPYKRLLVASYRLPFHIAGTGSDARLVQNSGGLVSAMLAVAQTMSDSTESTHRIIWFGKSDEPEASLKKMTRGQCAYQMVPVYIDTETETKFYHGFSNEFLWPLFHYYSTLAKSNDSCFEGYVRANELFCQKIYKEVRKGDLIWIHDYQLLLLPAMLRKLVPEASIGFFLHIPFPSFEVFRLMSRSWREALLLGILGADVVGFHTYDYVRYFLNTVSRTLGYETTPNTVNTPDRFVRIDAFPIGIDFSKFDESSKSKVVAEQMLALRKSIGKTRLVFSIDRLDYTKGFINRLEGYEYFLETYPQWHEKVIFNMVVIPSRDSIPRYQEMKKEIEAMVGRINGKYGSLTWRPVVYQYKSLEFEEMVALYTISDVALITPLRDGMNLVAKEFVACQTLEKGVLILSEMAGAAAELGEAITINPVDRKEMGDAIQRALIMPANEREMLMARMRRHLAEYNVFVWAGDFVESVGLSKKDQDIRKVRLLYGNMELQLLKQYAQSSCRALFLDYDGTLVPFARFPELAVPDEQTLRQVEILASIPGNHVVIISGRDKTFLADTFSRLKVSIIAEHGAYFKPQDGNWRSDIDTDEAWKTPVRAIMQRYVNRSNGSFIEEKEFSLVWHYRNTESELGAVRSNELKQELREIASHETKLHMLEGEKVIEIKRAGYDKGLAAAKFLAGGTFDFALAVGDDRTDEDLFNALPQDAFTIKIGLTPSLARNNLRSQKEVGRLLDKLIARSRSS